MMLDTLTNVFGSIILIACVLTILPRELSRAPVTRSEEARGEIVERRMEAAEKELRRIQGDLAELAESVDPDLAKLLERRDRLKTALAGLRAKVGEAEDDLMSDAKLKALANQADPDFMAAHLGKLKALLADEEAKSSAIKDKLIFLKDRMRDLKEEAGTLKGGRTETVRFPREKGTRRGSFPVIVIQGAVYPLAIGADLSENPGVARRALDLEDESFIADPIAGRGIKLPADRAVLRETIDAAKKQDTAISVYLYPDSHEVLQDLKAEIFAAGAAYGIEFMEKGQTLKFGEDGSQPPEL